MANEMCILHSDGLYRRIWNQEKRKYIIRKTNKPTKHLTEYIRIEEGTTLGDIMRFTRKYKLLSKFISEYSNCKIENFDLEINRTPRINENDKISFLQISWATQKYNEICLLPDFLGISEETGTRYAIEFSPIYELSHLLVKIDTTLRLVSDEICVTKTLPFTLLDVLHAIFSEISFFDSPEQRDETLNDLKEQVETIQGDNRIKEVLGEIWTLDEIIKEIEEKDEGEQ